MMQSISFRMQIFLTSLILVILPTIILGIFTANRSAQQVDSQYREALTTVTGQINLNLETMLSDAEKIGNLYIINDDIRRALITDYDGRITDYAKDSNMMVKQVGQANRLNTNVTSSLFVNRYGYTFEYNVLSVREHDRILQNIELWRPLALANDRNTYFGPVQTDTLSRQTLPMIKILWDVYSNVEIGAFYMAINFDAVTHILDSSSLSNSQVAFFDQNNRLFFSTGEGLFDGPDGPELLERLQEVSRAVSKARPELEQPITINDSDYRVHAVFNSTTSWTILHFMDDSIMTSAYRQNLQGYVAIFGVSLLAGLLLAFLLSHGLADSIRRLTRAIDSCESGDIGSIRIQGGLSSKELRKVTDSYNRLYGRLNDTLEQNFYMQLSSYAAQLNEKQMQLKMLQAQINPHFLYNTLNLIGSIANLHGISDIKAIATSISDMLRYNLKAGPIVCLEDEISQVTQYMAIHQIRFPGKFQFRCEAPPEALATPVPIFLLQPLVENAVIHGLEEKKGEAIISIYCYTEGNSLHLLVTDNGAGIPPDKLDQINAALRQGEESHWGGDGNSIGILNVHQRIRTFYTGTDWGLRVESTVGTGTTVDVCLPLDQSPVLSLRDLPPVAP